MKLDGSSDIIPRLLFPYSKEGVMDLKPLVNNGDVSEREFGELFERRLGALFPRAKTVFLTLGEVHSFPVANVLHLALQKGNLEEVINALENWCKVVATVPDLITAHVGTKRYFDTLYTEYFMTGPDTVDGVGPLVPVERNGKIMYTFAKSEESKIWLPPHLRK